MSKFPFEEGDIVIDKNNVEFFVNHVTHSDQARIHCSLVHPDSVKGFREDTNFCFEWPRGDGKYLVRMADFVSPSSVLAEYIRVGDVFFDSHDSRYDLKEITGGRFLFDVTRKDSCFTILTAISRDEIQDRLCSDLKYVRRHGRGYF